MVVVINPYAPEVMADPGTHYDAWRERCPVAKVEVKDPPFYIISGYGAVVDMMNNHTHWSKIDGALLQKNRARNCAESGPTKFQRLSPQLYQLPFVQRCATLGGGHSAAGD